LLSNKKVQEVISLLGQGLSKNETAMIAGVCRKSVYNIEHGKHRPKRRDPVRCPDCGNLITSFPCLICNTEQVARPVHVSPHEAGPLSLDLRGKVKERYEAVRRKVEAEIATGTRTADSGYYY
jgi:hypothetical protein